MNNGLLMCIILLTISRQIKAYGEDTQPSVGVAGSADKTSGGSDIPINPIVNDDTTGQTNSNTNIGNQGAFNFDRNQVLGHGAASGISFVGNVDDISSNNINTNTGAHEHVFPDNGEQQPVFNGVSMVNDGMPGIDNNMQHVQTVIDNSEVQTLNSHFAGTQGNTNTNIENQGAFNFDRDQLVGPVAAHGVSFVGNVADVNSNNMNTNTGAHQYVFPDNGEQQPVFNGVSMVDNGMPGTDNNIQHVQSDIDNSQVQSLNNKFVGTQESIGMNNANLGTHTHVFPNGDGTQTVFDGVSWTNDENKNTGSFTETNVQNTGGSTWNEQLSKIPGVKFVGIVDSEHTFDDSMNGQTVFPGVKWVDNVDFSDKMSNDDTIFEPVPTGNAGFNVNVGTQQVQNDQNVGISAGDGTAAQIWTPMNCYIQGVTYEEGSGVRSRISPCLMYVCEEGQMVEYPTACYMNGVCYAEGTTWTDGCVEYTCQVTNSVYRAVQVSKGCQFQMKSGETKCLRDGEIVRDGPCKKRRCTVSKVNDKIVTELPLVENFGGCGYARGCRSLGEVWTYRCVIKRCITDGQNFIKLPLHASCIRKGQCYTHGQSYTTPNTCVTRTCFVNNFINKAWFTETSRGCRFQGMCIDEGEKRIRRCKEYTCTKSVTNNGNIKMTMKISNNNACDSQTNYG